MINNYQAFTTFLDDLKARSLKPTLLLHSCCGPCSSHVLKILAMYFDITIYYYNPNIYPDSEFVKRLNEQKKLINKMHLPIKVIEGAYDYNQYLTHVKGLEHLGERSKRCYACYEFRLAEAFNYAKNHHFDYYTTTLSVSPYKNSDWINEIGSRYQTDKCKYLYSNFKKKDGYKDSIKLAKEYDIYRQDYCGCAFSIIEHEARSNSKQG